MKIYISPLCFFIPGFPLDEHLCRAILRKHARFAPDNPIRCSIERFKFITELDGK